MAACSNRLAVVRKRIVRGQTWSFPVRVLQDGDPFDLDGGSLFLGVKESAADSDPHIFLIQSGGGITHRDQATDTGWADVVATTAETASLVVGTAYVWDLWLKITATGHEVPIVLPSPLTVIDGVTDVP